MPTVGPERFR